MIYQRKRRNLDEVFSLTMVLVAGFCYAKTGPITRQEILEAQKAWGNGVVAIGESYSNGKDYRKTAEKHVDDLYAYQLGEVLFTPTKASEKQFRLTKEGALSYFVGGNEEFPEDKGFALEPWTNVRFENAGMSLHGDYAVAMGNYFFTPKEGKEVKVEYTFGYIKDKDGKLRINLHHSSLPYERKAMKKASARHILVSSKEVCEDLKAQIEKGADFAKLAKEHSTCPSGKTGGNLGEFSPGMMVKEFDEVVFSAEPNKVQGPVKTEFGYHLIEVTSRKEQ